jgi:medium-chain acyl-[acyl-carrier-protein] hydrolase
MTEPGSWLVHVSSNSTARLRLFCFPYAGVGAAVYRSWMGGLPHDVDVSAVQLPGREHRLREAPFDRLSELVPAIARGLEAYLDIPFVIFGHSMGALIGFELCRYLRAQNRPCPRHLFVSGRRAPDRPESLPPLAQLPDPAFIEAVQSRWGGLPAGVMREPDLMRLLLPALRADVGLVETYVYAPALPLECAVSCFGGEQDSTVTVADLAAWRDYTTAGFHLRMFPGGHFFLRELRGLVLRAITEDLTPVLRRVRHANVRGESPANADKDLAHLIGRTGLMS